MEEKEEESILTVITEKEDTRSDFDRAFADDTLYMLQDRMIAKAKTKKFTPEEFVEKAEKDLDESFVVIESVADGVETPEPDDIFEEEESWF